MKLDQIKYILEIVKLGSINKAASSLLMTQPNLSQSVKLLEDELGFKIFNRSKKGIELTRKGALFLDHAKSMQDSYNLICGLADNKSVNDSPLKFSISVQYFSPAFYSLIDLFKANNSANLNFKVRQTNLAQIINDVCSNSSELGFICIDESQRNLFDNMLALNGLEFVHISNVTLYAYMLDNHPLAIDNSCVKLDELIKFPLLLLDFISKDFLYSSSLSKIKLDEFTQRLEVNDYYYLMHGLNELNGITFTFKFPNLKPMPNLYGFNGVFRSLDIDNDFNFKFGYIKLSNNILSPISYDFINLLINNLNK
ncbi:LysR family transcriptional regulator [Terrisporobacter petrolearius]|uniref:LysR family transcriptional regulator n=1 Tax=Terrisporobacter petrolearius TaxID=1460447 RepID=UPI0031CCA122